MTYTTLFKDDACKHKWRKNIPWNKTNFGVLPWFDPTSEYPIHSSEWSGKQSDEALLALTPRPAKTVCKMHDQPGTAGPFRRKRYFWHCFSGILTTILRSCEIFAKIACPYGTKSEAQTFQSGCPSNLNWWYVYLLVSLWQRASAQIVRLYYPYWQYTNLFIFRFVSEHCLHSTLHLLSG